MAEPLQVVETKLKLSTEQVLKNKDLVDIIQLTKRSITKSTEEVKNEGDDGFGVNTIELVGPGSRTYCTIPVKGLGDGLGQIVWDP